MSVVEQKGRRMKRELLYAPIDPFAVAVNEWLARYRNAKQAHPWGKMFKWPEDQGMSALARECGLSTRQIYRVATRESEWIEIDFADRIAMGLGIPLGNLAEEFKPPHETTWRKVPA